MVCTNVLCTVKTTFKVVSQNYSWQFQGLLFEQKRSEKGSKLYRACKKKVYWLHLQNLGRIQYFILATYLSLYTLSQLSPYTYMAGKLATDCCWLWVWHWGIIKETYRNNQAGFIQSKDCKLKSNPRGFKHTHW